MGLVTMAYFACNSGGLLLEFRSSRTPGHENPEISGSSLGPLSYPCSVVITAEFCSQSPATTDACCPLS